MAKNKFQSYFDKEAPERVVLVKLITDRDEKSAMASLDELWRLTETVGGEVAARMIQSKDKPDPATYIGSGKLKELSELCENAEITLAVFDCELSPSQIKNLEDGLKDVRVIDRSMLILDIFALHATTGEGKLQVELAQLKYTVPRLTGQGEALSRQGGSGSIAARGPGESKLETDRRYIKRRIVSLERQLAEMEQNRRTQRAQREKSGICRVTIAGYTNAGKSTLLNYLTDAGILAENKLFATLDTTVRKVVIENVPFLLSDTVGFIRKLPHQLVEAFKSTLDEVREADILMHVVDISHPNFEDHIRVVEETLKDIKAIDKPIFVVFNKIDAYRYEEYDEFSLEPKKQENYTLDEFKNSWIARENTPCIFISAREKIGIDKLRGDLYKMVAEIHAGRYPFDNFLW